MRQRLLVEWIFLIAAIECAGPHDGEETNAASHSLATEAHALFSLISQFKFSAIVDARQEVPTQSPPLTQRNRAVSIARGRAALAQKQESWEEF